MENWIHYDGDDKLSSARIVQHNGSKERTLNKRKKMAWERIENKVVSIKNEEIEQILKTEKVGNVKLYA